MKKIQLASIIVFALLSCNQKKTQESLAPETPIALQQNASSEYSLLSKRSGREDLVESLYAELVNKTPELKDIEKQIIFLNEARTDSLEGFSNFNQKNKDYYDNAVQHSATINDSVLSNRIKLMISNSQSKYSNQVGGHKSLISLLDSKAIRLQDMHVLLKIVKTLPLIEKFQKDKIPDKKPIEKTINEYDKTIKKIETISNQ